MIKVLENGKVLVAHITIDNKNATKEYIEDVLGSCLASLEYNLTPLISNLNGYKAIIYNNFISIDTFVQQVKKSVEINRKNKVELDIKYSDNSSALELFISCDFATYDISTYANKNFMLNVHGFEKMIVNVEIDKIDTDYYYWFTHPNIKVPMFL